MPDNLATYPFLVDPTQEADPREITPDKRSTPCVTRLRLIDFHEETGHKCASRGKEFNSERRRSGTACSDGPVPGRIVGSISGDLRAARSGGAPVSVAFGRPFRNRRRSASGDVSADAPVES